MSIFYIKEKGNEPHRNCLAEINKWLEDGAVKVTLSRKGLTRSQQQNKVLHMWIADIHQQTFEPLHEIGGRCKLQYFVPVLLASESDKAGRFQDIWQVVEANTTYEKQVEILGLSDIASTSLLSSKEFSQALTTMRVSEQGKHWLRDPALRGLSI
ncbi:MAG: hypothetical protein KGV56_00435 [Gammaproteobacteria bacterium]|nr:hypothetical protein [Gammaproteobacteria bacterium]